MRLFLVADLRRAAREKFGGSAEALAQLLATRAGGSVAQRCTFLAGGRAKAPGSRSFARDFSPLAWSGLTRFAEREREAEERRKKEAREGARRAAVREMMESHGYRYCDCDDYYCSCSD
jgi:hypothetical protein